MLQYSPRPVRHRDEEHVPQLLLAGSPQPPEVEKEGEGVALGSQLKGVVEAAGGGVRAAAEKEPWQLGKVWIFEFFQNYTPPGGGSTQKSISRLTTGPRGWPMANLIRIYPVVWAPNPNKQTNKQTDTSLLYSGID